MISYLNDKSFLKELYSSRIREEYVQITLLDWDEMPIRDIIGKVINGSIAVDGKSSVRKSGNLSILVDDAEVKITDINNLFSINKKISIKKGLKNTTNQYRNEEIIWFPQGTFVICNASLSHNTNGINLSLQFKDKMCLLNGECGGVLPANCNFNEWEWSDDYGKKHVGIVPLYYLIKELVNHFGGEQLGRILISDVPKTVSQTATPKETLYVYNENGITYITDNKDIAGPSAKTYEPQSYIGYINTDFVYPGKELNGNAGASVTSVLDSIISALGNYEYYYDENGNFIFRKKKNYLNTSKSTIDLKNINNNSYVLDYSSGKTEFDFSDCDFITSFSNNPQYGMIKNEFVIWGERVFDGKQYPIRYRLAIDSKPKTGTLRWIDVDFNLETRTDNSKYVPSIKTVSSVPSKYTIGADYIKEGKKIYKYNKEENAYVEAENVRQIEATDWRTELYLEGLCADTLGTTTNEYYIDLKNEWPKLYDIYSLENSEPQFFKDVLADPSKIDYYLDFIDSGTEISKYNISAIGRRSKIETNNEVNCIFEVKPPNMLIIEEGDKDAIKDASEKMQPYALTTKDILKNKIVIKNPPYSAYEYITAMLYEYTSYNEAVTLSSLPIYTIQPNTRVYIKDELSDIDGEYIISGYTIPFDISSQMTFSATRVVDKM